MKASHVLSILALIFSLGAVGVSVYSLIETRNNHNDIQDLEKEVQAIDTSPSVSSGVDVTSEGSSALTRFETREVSVEQNDTVNILNDTVVLQYMLVAGTPQIAVFDLNIEMWYQEIDNTTGIVPTVVYSFPAVIGDNGYTANVAPRPQGSYAVSSPSPFFEAISDLKADGAITVSALGSPLVITVDPPLSVPAFAQGLEKKVEIKLHAMFALGS